ncbi:MAG: hypothetical protein IMY73_03150 [Bacteroidetes bacterium]|nr:hypothetical protein [Bacteroidota bacterium]
MGLISRIRLGFVLIALLLLMVGATSYFEIRNLNKAIEIDSIERNQKNIHIEDLVLSQYNQKDIISQFALSNGNRDFYMQSRENLAYMITIVEKLAQYNTPECDVNEIEESLTKYKSILVKQDVQFADSLNNWYNNELAVEDKILSENIVKYINSINIDYINKENNHLSSIYRKDVRTLITLLTCMLVLFMFFVLIRILYLLPILNIKKGIEGYLYNNRPYEVKSDGSDEVKILNGLVEQLVQNSESSEDVENK